MTNNDKHLGGVESPITVETPPALPPKALKFDVGDRILWTSRHGMPAKEDDYGTVIEVLPSGVALVKWDGVMQTISHVDPKFSLDRITILPKNSGNYTGRSVVKEQTYLYKLGVEDRNVLLACITSTLMDIGDVNGREGTFRALVDLRDQLLQQEKEQKMRLRPGRRCFLVRGLPGSGKSAVATALIQAGVADDHINMDEYLISPTTGQYEVDPLKRSEGHLACLEALRVLLRERHTVVVSNVLDSLKEIQQYRDICAEEGLLPHDVVEIDLFDGGRLDGELASEAEGFPKETIRDLRQAWFRRS